MNTLCAMPASCNDEICHMSWRAHADAHSCVLCVLMFGFGGYLLAGGSYASLCALAALLLLHLALCIALLTTFCASSPAPSAIKMMEVVQVV